MIIMGFIERCKKGDLTSFQIINIVLAIAGFVVVLIFLSILFSDRGETDREVCRLSILTRATAPDILQANVPLKCKTEKICITTKLFGGECNQFLGEENELPPYPHSLFNIFPVPPDPLPQTRFNFPPISLPITPLLPFSPSCLTWRPLFPFPALTTHTFLASIFLLHIFIIFLPDNNISFLSIQIRRKLRRK